MTGQQKVSDVHLRSKAHDQGMSKGGVELVGALQAIPNAGLCEDVRRTIRLRLDLLPQLPNVCQSRAKQAVRGTPRGPLSLHSDDGGAARTKMLDVRVGSEADFVQPSFRVRLARESGPCGYPVSVPVVMSPLAHRI